MLGSSIRVRVRVGIRVRVKVKVWGGYVPTTFTRLVRCDNRVQYTGTGIQ